VLMIRLARVGARKQPHYRIVVIEKDRARNGRSVEVVGTYNPRTNPATVNLKRTVSTIGPETAPSSPIASASSLLRLPRRKLSSQRRLPESPHTSNYRLENFSSSCELCHQLQGVSVNFGCGSAIRRVLRIILVV
jgi:ribosomal protein S16